MTLPPLVAQSRISTPLGAMTLAATARGLAGAWFDGQAHHPGPLAAPVDGQQPWLQDAAAQLSAYFAGRLREFSLPLDAAGTPFQQAVWQALAAVPHGATTHYGAIALALGRPEAARAVGAAVGRNPLSLVVPCHRVLGRDGSLTGYAGGLDRKRALLALEAAGPLAAPSRADAAVS
jgi:methylated-DNA-[protein]-cysteine S-methyltransferase